MMQRDTHVCIEPGCQASPRAVLERPVSNPSCHTLELQSNPRQLGLFVVEL